MVDGCISNRKAENYSNGNNNELNHSQYKKLNTSLGVAYKTSDLSSVRVDAIFDRAKDVVFPALPIETSLSRALITSVAYKQFFKKGIIKIWDTKVYFNAIEHYMDDTVTLVSTANITNNATPSAHTATEMMKFVENIGGNRDSDVTGFSADNLDPILKENNNRIAITEEEKSNLILFMKTLSHTDFNGQ
ncbi:hypothetical protein [Polaribacter sp. L3A8]|uniref:hypothetical protein n=1 Tax=Polaribacter sp. L3A8 TaxID=2686361 RepID=UPI003F93A0F6